MSTIPATHAKTGVTLLRLGQGKEEVELPEGSTLADLLRLAGSDAKDFEILVDGRPIEEALVLQAGTIVTLGEPRKQTSEKAAWIHGIGDFHDDPDFESMMDQVNAERKAEKQAS